MKSIKDRPARRTLANVVVVQWLTYGAASLGFLALSIESARLLGVGDFGYFVAAVAACFLVGQAVLFGSHRIGLRDAAIVRDDPALLGDVLAQTRLVSRVLVPVATAIVVVGVVGVVDGSATHRVGAGAVAGLLIFLTAQQRLWSCFLRGIGSQTAASVLDGASGGPLTLVSQALAFLAFDATHAGSPSLLTALAMMVLGQAPWVLLTWCLVRRSVPGGQTSTIRLRTILQRSWRFSVVQLTAYAGASVELWIATLVLPAAGVSLLGAAQRLSLAVVAPLTALQIVASPVIARVFADHDRRVLAGVVRGSGGAAMITTLPFLLPLLIVPGFVLATVFGPEFSSGHLLLAVLAAGQLVNLSTGLCGPLLTMTGHEGLVARVTLVALVARVAVGVPLAATAGLTALVVVGSLISAVSWIVLFAATPRLTGVSSLPSLRIADLRRLSKVAG